MQTIRSAFWNKTTDTLHQLSEEIVFRLRFAESQISPLSDVASVRRSLTRAPFRNSSFKDYTLLELYDRYYAVNRRINSNERQTDHFQNRPAYNEDYVAAIVDGNDKWRNLAPISSAGIKLAITSEMNSLMLDDLNDDNGSTLKPACASFDVVRAIYNGTQAQEIVRRVKYRKP